MAEDVSLNMAGAQWPPGEPRKVGEEIRRELWYERHGVDDRREDDTGSW